ncbi:unnamed protein product [Nippostrongylus brasiliensis]|uniref:COesterase domain-containing protein n=1 Tax=Nippostrongylus brasiliensis TaxID=27835 RepID=A0A158R1P8_NIPBR|nr:unnamed protein product [Nippostrongylus brasiliensis]
MPQNLGLDNKGLNLSTGFRGGSTSKVTGSEPEVVGTPHPANVFSAELTLELGQSEWIYKNDRFCTENGFFTTYTAEFPPNIGMLDQVQALQWVNSEIRNFGGDPNRVTLCGQGDGGCAVSAHTLSPMSQIMQCLTKSMATGLDWRLEKLSPQLHRGCVCKDGRDKDCLDVDYNPNNLSSNLLRLRLAQSTTAAWMIVRDDTFLPDSIDNLASRRPRIPIIIGTVQDESADYAFKLVSNGEANEGEDEMFNNWMVDFARQNRLNPAAANQVSQIVSQNYNVTPNVPMYDASSQTPQYNGNQMTNGVYQNSYQPTNNIYGNTYSNSAVGCGGSSCPYTSPCVSSPCIQSSTNGNNNFNGAYNNQNTNTYNGAYPTGGQVSSNQFTGYNYPTGVQYDNPSQNGGSYITQPTVNTNNYNNNAYSNQNYGNANSNSGYVNQNSGYTYQYGGTSQVGYQNQAPASGQSTYQQNQNIGSANEFGLQYEQNTGSIIQPSVTNPQTVASLQTISQFLMVLSSFSFLILNSIQAVYKGQDMYFLFMSETVWTSGTGAAPTTDDRRMADQMGQKWTDFAKNGQVNNWQPTKSQDYSYCNLNRQPTVQTGYAQQARSVFNDQAQSGAMYDAPSTQTQTTYRPFTFTPGSAVNAQYSSNGPQSNSFQFTYQLKNVPGK